MADHLIKVCIVRSSQVLLFPFRWPGVGFWSVKHKVMCFTPLRVGIGTRSNGSADEERNSTVDLLVRKLVPVGVVDTKHIQICLVSRRLSETFTEFLKIVGIPAL